MVRSFLTFQPNLRFIQLGGIAAVLFFSLLFLFRDRDGSVLAPEHILHDPSPEHATNSISDLTRGIDRTATYFLDYPLTPPYKNIFGELGERAKLLRSWIEQLQAVAQTADHNVDDALKATANLTEQVALSLFPYLKSPASNPHNPSPPLARLRHRLARGNQEATGAPRTTGIVIPTGQRTLRYACHLLASLTRVHHTKLPIQIAYAGEEDLPGSARETVQRCSQGMEIEFVDVLTAFDDSTLKLAKGGWAIKPFAALASSFDQVILLDADVVFLQDPAALLRQDRFVETGALLFHDRLLWKDGFKERQDWWHDQLKHPTPETNKSLVWTERYSEEGDSGIVVVDKSRLDVLIGLLHIGWQNSYEVREEWTYKVTYGDKETWWIGFEATGSRYSFSHHYGGMVGWLKPKQDSKDKEGDSDEQKSSVCSFVIAHCDEIDKLLWYNGGLLKNKLANQTEYDVPTHWMMDQEWRKGAKTEMSCMIGTEVNELTQHEMLVLSENINAAKYVDEQLGLVPAE